MRSENEPARLLLPYLQRADELQKHEPLVAYYCRVYAMERGLKIPHSDRTNTTNALLVSLIKQLEKDKNSLKLGTDDILHLEGFALSVFEKADNQDRAGRADMNTAKTFYAATIFFETLNQFGELQPDLEQKQKYAAWKAADIRKALKEGRKPVPGTPAGDKDHSVPSITSNGEYEVVLGGGADCSITPESRRSNASRTAAGSESLFRSSDEDKISTFLGSVATTTPSISKYNPSGWKGNLSEGSPPAERKYKYYEPPAERISEAHKAARFAVGALSFDDVSIAVEHLKKSLELLTNPSSLAH